MAGILERLRDAFGDRVFFGAPAQPRRMQTDGRDTHYDAPIIYIHAKVMVIDDRAAIVSSANLNGRSMRWDSETGIELAEPGRAEQVFSRCCDHWFPDGAPGDLTRAATWTRAAQDAHDMPDTSSWTRARSIVATGTSVPAGVCVDVVVPTSCGYLACPSSRANAAKSSARPSLTLSWWRPPATIRRPEPCAGRWIRYICGAACRWCRSPLASSPCPSLPT